MKNRRSAVLPEDKYLEFLVVHGAYFEPHGPSNLLNHLVGTWNILKGWDMPEHVRLAGLFHSIYGTEAFKRENLPKRQLEVRSIIGPDAERLVYTFCVARRAELYEPMPSSKGSFEINRFDGGQKIIVSANDYYNLVHILLANWLDQQKYIQLSRNLIISERFSSISEIFCDRAIIDFTQSGE